MFQPKFRLIVDANRFYPNTAICLGSQMISIVNFLETKLGPHMWYAADVDAFGLAPMKYNLNSRIIKKIGPASSLIKICSEVDQFLSGVFLAVKNADSKARIDIEVSSEDEPFRPLNMDDVLIEVRAFDTSYFEFFSEDETLIKALSENYGGNVTPDI